MGCLYLIQPCELLGTNRYKIGMSSKNDLSRMKAYKKNSRYICIMECDNFYHVERLLISHFKYKYNLIAGAEYFEGCENNMLKDFIKIIMDNKFDSNEEIPETYIPKVQKNIRPCISDIPLTTPCKNLPISLFSRFSFNKK